jgi:hypothetical protein
MRARYPLVGPVVGGARDPNTTREIDESPQRAAVRTR